MRQREHRRRSRLKDGFLPSIFLRLSTLPPIMMECVLHGRHAVPETKKRAGWKGTHHDLTSLSHGIVSFHTLSESPVFAKSEETSCLTRVGDLCSSSSHFWPS